MLILLSALFGFTVANLLLWPRLSAAAEGAAPKVSVLVPARDEAANIGPCMASLALQQYPNFEVLLLDDHSTDGTADVARAAAPSVRILPGAPLPSGWLGKSWACHQLAQAATGEYLLFVDADTVHTPDMLARVMATATSRGAGLLSGLPRQTSDGLGATLLVAIQFLLIACFLPVALIARRNHPSIVAASGGFLLFRRDVYQAVGGHGAIRNSMVDDLALGRRTKELGNRVVWADLTPVVACRMYRSGPEAWAGFTKNAYPAMGRSVFVLLISVAAMVGLFLAPLLLWNPLALALAMAAAALVYGRFRLPPWLGLLVPLQAAAFAAIALSSAWRHWTGRGYQWKGRTYA